MTTYGQFCPVAKAMEVLDERWTMLVLRELMAGSTRFNEIRRGVPRMSPALLSKRLRSLTRAGLVERSGEGPKTSYALSPSGQELVPVIQQIGVWGLRWIPELGEEELDPHLLMWDMSRTVPVERWPRERTVVELTFDDVRADRSWWFVVNEGATDVCDVDPGFEVSVRVDTGLRTMVRLWRGEESWEVAQRKGLLRLHGPHEVRRRLPEWIGRSTVAELAATTA